MSNSPISFDGDDYFALGADQFTTAQKVPPGRYASGENIICRGGVAQTRPGSRSMITLPDGLFQGATLFKPASGIPHLVAAVDGSIYVSPYPFRQYRKLDGLQFRSSAQYVAWAVCLKSSDYTEEGELYFLDNPYSVLIIQDGYTRAGVWDGATAQHLNPTKSSTIDPTSGSVITQPGYDGTPIGLWMAWANNRLWVSRGNQVFASDVGNPTKFTESQYLNEARAFYLPEVCTGIAPTTDSQGIVCFTEQTGTFLYSSIQDRATWLSTPNFQYNLLPNTGCVSPRSIVAQYGLLWWYSSKGLINQDDALKANITSRLNIQDNAMFATKANMSFNLAGVAGCSYENMLLMSVPWGDKLNRRTMVLDQSPVGDLAQNVNSWASYWTGWRPVEWASGVVNGEERIFFGSVDYDGKNRIWELGTDSKTDNGVPITCNMITRDYLFGNRDYKTLSHAEIELTNIKGDVSMMVCAAGVRGGWQKIMNKEIVSSFGQVYWNKVYGSATDSNKFAGTSTQTRVLKTQNYIGTNECNSACVEADLSGLIDKSFSLMVSWSGEMGVSCVRLFSRSYDNVYNGNCEVDEVGPNLLNDYGCGVKGLFSTTKPFELFSFTAGYRTTSQATGQIITAIRTARSIISQRDADRKAYLAAKSYVDALIENGA